MEEKHKKVLNRNTEEFTDNLNPDDVIPYLISKEILSQNDVQKLESFNILTQKVISLISILQRKGPEAFKYFLEALEKHPIYNHLVLKINDCIKEYDNVRDDVRDKWQWSQMTKYQSAAVDYCSEALNRELPFEAACEYFLNVGFLEKGDIAFMEKLPEQSSQRSILIVYVKGKGKVAYGLLLDFLQERSPSLKTLILKAEEAMKEKEKQFRGNITFTFKEKEFEGYSEVPRQLNIILIGKTGSGKSATGNRLVDKRNTFLEVSGSASGTKTVQKETANVHGFEINVLDTPGLFDTTSTLGNEDIILEIMKTTQEFSKGVHLFLFVCRGDVRFTHEEMKTFDQIEKYFGNDLLKHCLLVMTNAEEAIQDATFQEYLKKNEKLHTIFKKTRDKAIAIENTDQGNSMIDGNMKREQLVHAIVDVVHCNDGKSYSSSIFKETQIQLEYELGRTKLHDKINDLTFAYVIKYCPGMTRPSSLNVEIISEMTATNFSVNEKSLLSNEDMNRIFNIYLEDCKSFLLLLLQMRTEDQKLVENIKEEHPDKSFPDNIITYVMQCFQSEEILHKLKADESLPEDVVNRIITESPFPKTPHTQYKQTCLIKKYIEIIDNAFKRQTQRRELIKCIHSDCRDVIKEYFRTKSYTERKDIICTFIRNGCIPPDLHCLCLQIIPDKFKSNRSWEYTIEGILFQTLIDRVNTEDSICQSIVNIMSDAGEAVIKSLMISLSVLLIFPLTLVGKNIRPLFKFNQSSFAKVDCNECHGRHLKKMIQS